MLSPAHTDRVTIPPGESTTVERVYFWPLTDGDIDACAPGFAQNLILEVHDHASTSKTIRFSMGDWP
jgi:hypothetical protein